MQATVERNKITGEHSCVVGGKTLLIGKTGSSIKRVYDMAEAINLGAIPQVTTQGSGPEREFSVTLGEFVVASGLGAIKAYKELDKLEAALPPVVEIKPITGASEMPAVPVPEMGAGSTEHMPEGPF